MKYEKSTSRSSSSFFFKCAGVIWATTLLNQSAVGSGHSTATSSRLMRKITGVPILMWMSEAPPSTASLRIRLKSSMPPA